MEKILGEGGEGEGWLKRLDEWRVGEGLEGGRGWERMVGGRVGMDVKREYGENERRWECENSAAETEVKVWDGRMGVHMV